MLLSRFSDFIRQHDLFRQQDRLLIAVSGGIDSIVLCHLCIAAGYNIAIAHCNFKLRAEESDGDEKFVRDFAVKNDLLFFVKHFDTEKYAAEKKVSIQVAARELRYEWFSKLLREKKSDVLLTAHHADDNIETVLMNFFKGSGINGLKGILPKQQLVIRPLLFALKEDLLEYAKQNDIAFREDSSNSSDHYTRNYFRNQLIPGIEKIFPQVKTNLLHNTARFREINMIYDNAIAQTKKSLITKKGEDVFIPVLKLQKTPALTTVVHEIIRAYNFSPAQTIDVLRLLNTESGKYVLSSTHRILRNRKWLIISAIAEMQQEILLIEENDKTLQLPTGKLSIEKFSAPQSVDPSALVAQLDASSLEFPLLVRKWKQGDYFYPLGMKKKKKLSRFFIDQKLSLIDKENIRVIESNKKIVWVIGQRIDDRCKITPKTASAVRFIFLPA